jgi:hypothetical protein
MWLPSSGQRDYLERRKTDALQKYQTAAKKCLYCEVTLSFENRRGKFCGHSCAALDTNKRRRSKWRCTDCKTKVPAKTQRCKECRAKRRSLAFAKTDNFRRRLLIETHGHRCWGCRRTTWCALPIPLELDHVDGNSDNNSATNLRVLCPNCHAQTPTYRSKNRGRAGTRGKQRTRKKRQSKLQSKRP